MSDDRGPNDPGARRVPLALQAQLRVRRAQLDSGAARIGWKVGLHVAEVEEAMGSEPVRKLDPLVITELFAVKQEIKIEAHW